MKSTLEGSHGLAIEALRTVSVTTPAPRYDAQITALSVPTSMVVGSTYDTSITLKNTGNVTWVKANGYRLGTSSPVDNTIWGTARLEMPTATVAPGASTTFTFNTKAPSASGSYLFDWGMLWEGNLRFGATTNTTITVTAAAPKPTISVSLSALTVGQAATMT